MSRTGIISSALLLFAAAAVTVVVVNHESVAKDRLPPFTLKTLDGTDWSSTQHNNKVLVINFWATWCPPCRKEMPVFVDLQHEYASRGVEFIGIAIDNAESVRDFVSSYGVDFTILLGESEGAELTKQLGNKMGGLPYTVIVDSNGIVHTRHIGAIEREQLDPILAQLSAD